jgi:predicted ATPase
MIYFSRREIESSIRRLAKVHPFFQITFLAAKRANLPIGISKPFRLDAITNQFLKSHFRLHPKSEHFFTPYRGAGKHRVWLNHDYASSGLQTINTQTFKDVFLHHPKSSSWGWKPDYVTTLEHHLQHKIPLWPLAVWIYRDMPLDNSSTPNGILSRFISEYSLTVEEIDKLFDGTPPTWEEGMFQDVPVEWHEIIAQYPTPNDVGPDKGGILSYLETFAVGPVSRLVFKPGSRLNIITGDNSLGKSFLLDTIWWALTNSWVGDEMMPYPQKKGSLPSITYQLAATTRAQPQKATFSFKSFTWSRPTKTEILPGLVVYARADGSYAIWDPARPERPGQNTTLHLSREAVWRGEQGRIEGLVRDWGTWKLSPDSPFELFLNVLARISPPELGQLVPGEPMRLPFIPQEMPTISHSYGDVAIVHESAGVRRMISLAYLIVWVWHQHRFNSQFVGRNAERQMVVLIDELEAHLHPRWQRVILPALLGVFNDLSSELNTQVFVASHSPLILASAEPVFRSEIDKLHSLETTKSGQVNFEELPFVPRGRVDEWLRSKAFGMNEPRSRPASDAISRAKQLQECEVVDAKQVQEVHQALVDTIPAGDTFWARWVLFAKKNGVKV